MKKNLFISLLITLLFLPVSAVTAQEALTFEDPRPFYTDIYGHHGIGQAIGANHAEAERLAKAAAIDLIFQQIDKDEMYQEMFISSFPEAITVEDSLVQENNDSTFTAMVRVLVDQNAVIMTEQPYRNTVINFLNRSESILNEAESLIASAQRDEENLRMSEAYASFRQAQSRIEEVKSLLQSLNDNSVLSDSGNNRTALFNIATSMETTIASGVERLRELASESERNEEAEESRRTFRLLENETHSIDAFIDEYLPLSPFYDMPEAELRTILTEVEANLDKIRTQLRERYQVLKENLPSDMVFLREQIDLTLSDLDTQEENLDRMRDELRLEIRNPRLQRQENARRSAEFWKNVGRGIGWFFLHDPGDILVFRWDLPFHISQEQGFQMRNEFNGMIRLERGFDLGVWLRTSTISDEITLTNSLRNSALSQEASIGFFNNFMFGLGFQWDWMRRIIGDNELHSGPAVSESEIMFHFGGIDHNYLRPFWLLSFSYRVPVFMNPFIVPYHFNIGLDIALRLENIVRLEAGLSTGCLQALAGESGNEASGYLDYLFQWNAGAMLRFPGPFGWGINYQGSASAAVVNSQMSEFTGVLGSWRGYIEYSF
ncbi:MAG: hypothetical protein ACLFR1_07475 [Spirochaetia bacterium]